RVSDAWSALGAFWRQATIVHRLRLPILRSYILFIIGLLLSWSLWSAAQAAWHRLLARKPGEIADPSNRRQTAAAGLEGLGAFLHRPGWLILWRQALLAVLMTPLALLLLPLVQPSSLA